ncbi:MAG: histidine kinase [Rikenellaceae bacterium]
MVTKILFIIAIIIHSIAMIYAIKLVRATKYNAIWILLIICFALLSAERYMQLINYNNGGEIPLSAFHFTGFVISIGLSLGVLYAHKLVKHIDRLTNQRTLLSKRILTAVLRTEEKSRSKFSKELHDGLGPLLSSAKMSISAVKAAKSEEERREIFENTAYVIDEAIRSLREISNNLSPQTLSDFGLERAIGQFISKSSMLHKTKIRFGSNLEGQRYDLDVEVIMYRVVCELINNSLKHSNCDQINLSLQHFGSELALDYSDNGRGFNHKAVMDCGMGLSNISSRINSLNGTFEITSELGGGGMTASIRVSVRNKMAVGRRS